MPKAKIKDRPINFSAHLADVAKHPEDYFSPEETKRRMDEAMGRLMGRPHTFNMTTGQNLKSPFLSDDELKARGYPCQCGWE